MKFLRKRRGFTLVELLVVIAVVVLLYGTMLVRLAPTKGGQCRDAANMVADALAEAWSRGLGNPAGSAVFIESAGTTAIALAGATVPPPIEGMVAGPIGSSVSVTNATDQAGLANGYRIQFYRTGSGATPPSPWFGYAGGSVFLRASAGQTADNTILPVGNNLQCRVLCRPTKVERLLTLPKGTAIDLRYSGIEGGALNSAGSQDIAIMFDGFGGLSGLFVGGTASVPATVYLLVAAASDIDRGGTATLLSPTSRWVVVTPQTGRVTVAANNPANNVSDARTFARPAGSIGR
jgi:prepilin-type N-terminal cleavage/methylation domain-containing protein